MDFLDTVLTIVIVAIVLWWLFHGLIGTYLVVTWLTKGGFWENSCLIIFLGLIFGWNLILGALIFLVCLGPITEYVGKKVWGR